MKLQRATGSVSLAVGAAGLERLRESHSAKARVLPGGCEAVLINTAGGLAGGDEFSFEIRARRAAHLTVTSQAAERVYRTLGEAATVRVTLVAEEASVLRWLPQETILFEGAAFDRTIVGELAEDAEFLAVETLMLGRKQMGETVRKLALKDRWRVRRGGRLIFADDLVLRGIAQTPATLAGHAALATVLYVGKHTSALLDGVRQALGAAGAASAWDGKLVARATACDVFELRKALLPAFRLLAGGELPKTWPS